LFSNVAALKQSRSIRVSGLHLLDPQHVGAVLGNLEPVALHTKLDFFKCCLIQRTVAFAVLQTTGCHHLLFVLSNTARQDTRGCRDYNHR
jgi:hypothetical protein